ncbi:MAG: hypothetical protein FWE82_05725 [Defluviitaleaceae bacterium]|nr:hypothetical protein [Defluviitaleaceae bacterium]
MQCRIHPAKEGVNTCNQCGVWLCRDCTVEINGRLFCRACLAEMADKGTPAHGPVYPPRRTAPPRRINGFLLLVFSSLPGANYMYEGLIKRGLLVMSAFFALIYVSSVIDMASFVLIILWITCLFDAFQIRRRINAGELIPDNIEDITDFIRRNKTLIASVIIILAVLAAFRVLMSLSIFNFGFLFGGFRNLLPVAIIIGGLYILFKRPAKGGKKHDNDQEE